jgi:hypothetical protein
MCLSEIQLPGVIHFVTVTDGLPDTHAVLLIQIELLLRLDVKG